MNPSPQNESGPLLPALQRLAESQATPDDETLIRQTVLQSGGVNFGQNNQISISGSVIGSLQLGGLTQEQFLAMLQRLFPSAFQPEQITSFDQLPDPGNLPPGSRLSFSRNSLFTGRQDVLLALGRGLLAGPGKAAATGTGGVGKTQLAVEFCYRYGRFFHGVHWIAAHQDLPAEIAACGAEMGLQPWPDALPEQVSMTLQAWERGGPRLVVFDNAEQPGVVQDWLPQLGNARLLLTSRLNEWPPDLGLAVHPLDTLPRPESLALMRRLAPRLASAADRELERIAEALGDLPLALDLAGRYLGERRGLAPANFLAELVQSGSALEHTALKDWTQHNPTRHATSLAATFTLSWDRLESQPARQLFVACGYCAPNTVIPWEFLYLIAGASDSQAQAAADRHLGLLDDLGLLRLADQGASLHRLLAEFARSQDRAAEHSALPALAEALTQLGDQAIESGFPEQFRPLRPHVQSAAGWTEQAGLDSSTGLWNILGLHLQSIAEFAGAKQAFQTALHLAEARYGPQHPAVAVRVNNLGQVMFRLGELEDARAAFERAIAIQEAAFDPQDPGIAAFVNNLGTLLHDQGDLSAARAAYERALAIDEAALGPDHPDVATDVNNLGLVLTDLGELEQAQAAFERALAIDQAAFGEGHPDIAIRLNNLGLLWMDMGDLPKARAAFEQALAIDEAAFGPNHPNVSNDLNSLGGVLQKSGDLVGARAALERALAIAEVVYGQDHREVGTRLLNLGDILRDQGDLSAAGAAFQRAREIFEQTYGPSHALVARAFNKLGSVLRLQGDLEGSKVAFERVVAINEALLGPDDLEIGWDAQNLGVALWELGELEAARQALERALQIFQRSLPADDPQIQAGRAGLEELRAQIAASP